MTFAHLRAGLSGRVASHRRRGYALALLAVVCSACASGGGSQAGGIESLLPSRGYESGTNFYNEFTGRPMSVEDSVVAEPLGAVWGVMPEVFELLGIEPRTIDSRAFQIGNPTTRVTEIGGSRLSNFLNCGSGLLGPNADHYEVTMQIFVQLVGGPDSTLVRTTLDAYARPRSTRGDPVQCASERTLERLIPQLAATRLAPEPVEVEGLAATALRGRVPATGDRLLIRCRSPEGRVGEGRLMGVNGNALLLSVGRYDLPVTVPTASVEHVQILERRSPAKTLGVIGGILGGVGGYFLGPAVYDSEADNHYTEGAFKVGGVVLGLSAGALLGYFTGSLRSTETWQDAPPEWIVQRTTSVPDSEAGGGFPASCPDLDL